MCNDLRIEKVLKKQGWHCIIKSSGSMGELLKKLNNNRRYTNSGYPTASNVYELREDLKSCTKANITTRASNVYRLV